MSAKPFALMVSAILLIALFCIPVSTTRLEVWLEKEAQSECLRLVDCLATGGSFLPIGNRAGKEALVFMHQKKKMKKNSRSAIAWILSKVGSDELDVPVATVRGGRLRNYLYDDWKVYDMEGNKIFKWRRAKVHGNIDGEKLILPIGKKQNEDALFKVNPAYFPKAGEATRQGYKVQRAHDGELLYSYVGDTIYRGKYQDGNVAAKHVHFGSCKRSLTVQPGEDSALLLAFMDMIYSTC